MSMTVAPDAQDEMKAYTELLGCELVVFVVISEDPYVSKHRHRQTAFMVNTNGLWTL